VIRQARDLSKSPDDRSCARVRHGASGGGTHSLIAPTAIAPDRSARPWNPAEQVVRLSIGLEEPGELWSDLSGFLAALAEG
jgi:cystathionine beta-lyase/cystathionine gamma-synthase